MIRTTRPLFIKALPIRIRHAERPIRHLALLKPAITDRGDGEEFTQRPVDQARDDEPGEEVDAVDVRGADRDGFSDRADEADDVDEDAGDVGGVSAPGPAKPVEIGAIVVGGVEFLELEVALADDVVVADDDAGDAGKEDRICGEIGGEAVGVLEQVPGTHGEPDSGADVASAANVEEAREEGGHVGPGGDGVRGDVGAELGEGECRGDDEDGESFGGASIVEEHAEQGQRVPDVVLLREDDFGGRGDDDADEGCEGEAARDGEKLGPEGVSWLDGKAREIGVIDD